MPIDNELVEHISGRGYHPRTSKHSDFQSLLIIRDLVAQCSLLRERTSTGEIVANLRHHQQVGYADWVIDIAIGTCAGKPKPPDPLELGLTPIVMAPPVLI